MEQKHVYFRNKKTSYLIKIFPFRSCAILNACNKTDMFITVQHLIVREFEFEIISYISTIKLPFAFKTGETNVYFIVVSVSCYCMNVI